MGAEMLRLLPINAAKAIPIIYDRFKISYEKLREEKDEMRRKWHEDCDKSFSKSLDHRSFHFKQYEKKNSHAKSYIAEIKAIALKSSSSKNKFEMIGGTKDCEFYCTYSPFEHITVHS